MPAIDPGALIRSIENDDSVEDYSIHPNYRLLNLERKFNNSKQKNKDVLT